MNPYTEALKAVLDLGELPNEVLKAVCGHLITSGNYHLVVTERDPKMREHHAQKREAFRLLHGIVCALIEGNERLEKTIEEGRKGR
jgi:hypothetical protein